MPNELTATEYAIISKLYAKFSGDALTAQLSLLAATMKTMTN